MKIQCNACEGAEATVLCCADEAALCWACDAKIHAANKLASKHQRVPLSNSSSQMPKCDICQAKLTMSRENCTKLYCSVMKKGKKSYWITKAVSIFYEWEGIQEEEGQWTLELFSVELDDSLLDLIYSLALVLFERCHAKKEIIIIIIKSHLPPKTPSFSLIPLGETTGYFFCLEDRALLCRKCDIAIHTANPYVSAHKRFLLTGVRVGLEPTEPVDSTSKAQTNSMEKTIDSASKAKTTSMERTMETTSQTLPKHGTSLLPSAGKNEGTSGNQPSGGRVLPASRVPYSCSTMPGTLVDWPLEEFLGLTDFSQNYGFMEQGSSKKDLGSLKQYKEVYGIRTIKSGDTMRNLFWGIMLNSDYLPVDDADSANHGDSDWSPIYRAAFDEDLGIDECLGQVPQISTAKVPSPPTASGLYWPKNSRSNFLADNAVSVPDVLPSPPLGDFCQYQLNPADVSLKRRRMS
ncbi:hypothetical protein ACLOJK_010720 [Asimina triloba]